MLIFSFDPGSRTTGFAIFDTEVMKEPGGDPWIRSATGLLDCGTVIGGTSKRLTVRFRGFAGRIDAVRRHGIAKHFEAVGEAGPSIEESVALIEVPSYDGKYHRNRSYASIATLNRWIGGLAAILVGQEFDRVEYVEAKPISKAKRKLAVTAALQTAGQPVPDRGAKDDVFDSAYLGMRWVVKELWKEAA